MGSDPRRGSHGHWEGIFSRKIWDNDDEPMDDLEEFRATVSDKADDPNDTTPD